MLTAKSLLNGYFDENEKDIKKKSSRGNGCFWFGFKLNLITGILIGIAQGRVVVDF